MPIRPINLPDDMVTVAGIAAEIWDYPDHPEWNVQQDEVESVTESAENYRRVWPLIRLIQVFSPGMRDIIRGHVWEEDGRIVGFTQLGRRGQTGTWHIAAVGVHPDYRRRGIAQSLVQAGIELVRARNGERILLDVIDGNLPAVRLYEKLGFENFTTHLEMELQPKPPPEAPKLIPGYRQEPADDFTWLPRYELMQNITPPEVKRFEPVEEGRYKRPPMARLLVPIFKRAEGLQIQRFFVYAPDGYVAAYALYDTRARGTGRSSISAFLDPNHLYLAPYLVDTMLHHVLSANPDRMVDFYVPVWQEWLVEAARAAGFEVRVKLLTMGLVLDTL